MNESETIQPNPSLLTSLRNNIIVRLIVYYVVTLTIFSGLFRVFPQIPEYISAERARSSETVAMEQDLQSTIKNSKAATTGGFELLQPARSVPIFMAMMTAFLVTLPVAWVYRWTRPRKRYSQAFAHTLLVVPVAIALVVFLVKGSLALAFSLAGIVAAIRFRTALNEPMDAIYMFIVIGTGLAAGVQLLTIALIASIFFNAIALGVWRTNFGAQPAIVSGWQLVDPKTSGQLLGVSGVISDMSPGDEKSPYNAQLRVQTTKVEAAQRAAIPILDANAKRWQVGQIIQQEDGSSTVVFDVRLKKTTDLSAFIRQIEDSETKHVEKVELMQRPKKSQADSA
jgi:hypothetical protein